METATSLQYICKQKHHVFVFSKVRSRLGEGIPCLFEGWIVVFDNRSHLMKYEIVNGLTHSDVIGNR